MFILVVYFILTRIFGHSATDITISASLFTILSGIIYQIGNMVYKLNREFGEFKIKTIHSFSKLREDINKISKKIINATFLTFIFIVQG